MGSSRTRRATGWPLRVAVMTNAPVPYRSPMYAAAMLSGEVEPHLIYCTQPHVDASQQEAGHGYPVHFLGGRYWAMERRFFHADPAIWDLLDRIDPDVVITTGFIPTYLAAFAWSRWRRVPHVALTDGTLRQEAGLSRLHHALRRFVYGRSAAFIGASRSSVALLQHHGADPARCFVANLCIDNQRFALDLPKTADLLFSSRFVAHKNPLFALEAAAGAARLLGCRLTLNMLGEGPLRPAIEAAAQRLSDRLEVRLLGYRPQSELPAVYAGARLFLFPTAWEPWGLVANEACAAGLPVLVGEAAGSAHELVQDGVNGHVLPLDAEVWSQRIAELLASPDLQAQMGRCGRERVGAFTFESAAQALVQAVTLAAGRRGA